MKIEFRLKTLEELIKTDGIKMVDKGFTVEGEHETLVGELLGNLGRAFRSKEVHTESNGEQTPIIELKDGIYFINKWMCSEWEVCDEKEAEFEEIGEGFILEDDDKDYLEVQSPSDNYISFKNSKESVYFSTSSMGVNLTFEQFDEIVKYVNKLKRIKGE
ncbi:MAG: hypothetical protein ACRC28_18850 [Clostridium sp.]|uniref:hypothetical protein n=1 Tax=Clostridium sp. TaxID=1506 RepID=UPI003F3103A9